MATIRCSKGYKRLKNDELDVFAAGIRNGIFGHAIFMTPPILQVAFQLLIDTYFDTRAVYDQGGLGQKGAFNAAKKALLAGLDTMGAYVDTIAQGDANIITDAGFVPTKGTPTKKAAPTQILGVKATSPSAGLINTNCAPQLGVSIYVCIVTAEPLPAGIHISLKGQLRLDSDTSTPLVPQPEGAIMDFNAKRKKSFAGLTSGTRYYFTYFGINSRGVGVLSISFSMICQ